MKRALSKRLAVYAGYSALLMVFLTLFVGFLHTKAGRPWLARLGVGCPLRASPESVEAARHASAMAQRGVEASASRPALGFELDNMHPRDVEAWAESRHVSCANIRAGLVRCTDVPATALGGTGPNINRLDFGFALLSQRLVNISAWREELSPAAAALRMNEVVASMQAEVGAPTRQAGSRSAEYLAAGPLHTAVASYRFKDYIADVSATHIPGRGLLLREHYMSARD